MFFWFFGADVCLGRVFIVGFGLLGCAGWLGVVCEVWVPRDLFDVVGGDEGVIRFLRFGLLCLRVASLEGEVSELVRAVEVQRQRVADLPLEVERFEGLLAQALADRRVLEGLLGEKGSACPDASE